MQRQYSLICVWLLGMIFLVTRSHAQEIDVVDYFKLITPLQTADYVGEATGAPFVEQWIYSKDVLYNDTLSVKVERKKGKTLPEESLNTNYFTFDDDHLWVVGVLFELSLQDLRLPVELKFDPFIGFPRKVTVGQKVEQSDTLPVQIGILKANVEFSLAYEFVALENVTTPYGTFENVMRVNTVKSVSIPGLGQTLNTVEWYHPDVGLVKMVDVDTGSVIELKGISPQPGTRILHWSLFE